MLRRTATWLLGATGAILVAIGVAGGVATATGACIITVVVGALLLVSLFIIARVERLSASTSSFELKLPLSSSLASGASRRQV
jgi:hypothetical protein